MFAALFNRAQATVDNAIGQAINRAIVAVPFVIAGAFATAALTIRLTRILGDEYGYLAIAGIFVIVGLVAALVMQPSTATATASEPKSATADQTAEKTTTQTSGSAASDLDPELMVAALSTVAPIALPAIVRMILKNLPIVAVLAAALYVFTRQTGQPQPNAGMEPSPVA